MKRLHSELLKSVVVRFKKRQNRLLIPKNEISFLEVFLKKNISDDSIIINTNIGLGIYYASATDHSEIIEHCIRAYCQNNSENLLFLRDTNFEDLKTNFSHAFYTFASYPRLFLAYVKKFIYLRNTHAESKIVMPILNKLYNDALNKLHQNNELPFTEKIMKLDRDFLKSQAPSLFSSLAKRIISKEHHN